MLGWGKRNLKDADEAMLSLCGALEQHLSGGEIALYAEANAGTINVVVLCKSSENFISSLSAPDECATHVREIWTQFRLRDRLIWRAFNLTLNSDEGHKTIFHYPPNFDEALGFERRARRWAMENYGRAGLNALINRD
jgi:hypothetical protein